MKTGEWKEKKDEVESPFRLGTISGTIPRGAASCLNLKTCLLMQLEQERWTSRSSSPNSLYMLLVAKVKVSMHESCALSSSSNQLILDAAQKVESLLNADRKLVSRRDDDDRLPLHWAASFNRVPVVEFLSDQRGFDIDARDGAGWTALMMASSVKDGDTLVDLLLAKGADVDEKTNSGQTALHFAASKSNLDTARKLIAHKAFARVKDRRGQLPLHRAAAVGNVPIIKLLLENRSPINATDADACTALHHSIAEGRGDAALALLKAGAETDKKDSNGALPIDLAPDAKIRNYILRAAEEEGIEMALS